MGTTPAQEDAAPRATIACDFCDRNEPLAEQVTQFVRGAKGVICAPCVTAAATMITAQETRNVVLTALHAQVGKVGTMTKAPTDWMPLNIAEYLADTMDLSAEEHGAYLLLIMHYWKNRGPIKSEKNSLKNVSKISGKKTDEILQRFFVLRDGQWHHKRIDAELAIALEKKQKKADQTAAARAARWSETGNPTGSVTDKVTDLHAGTPLTIYQ